MTSPLADRQVPSIHRRRVGDAIVTAIGDGGLPSDPGKLQNITAEAAHAILAAAGRTPPLMTAINAFAVQTATQTVLIDTGAGTLMGPTAGRMLGHLFAAGITPDEIDVVLLTHMHIDHVGGLLDAEGAPTFRHATLLVPAAEAAFWLDEAIAARAPDAARPSFDLARRMTAPYGDRLQTFSGDPVPGVAAVKLPGHTPGHTGYMIDGGLLIWGDIVHAPDVQCRHPEAAVVFDTDQAQAIATRRVILARAAEERFMVAGMHMHFPAFAHVARDGDAFAFQPIAWLQDL